jgi:ABC-type Fe3+ transport system permease subunit
VILVILLMLSIPGIVAGIGLLYYKPWARILTIVLCALGLLNFPLGTGLGVYGLWVLLSPETTRLFEGRRV